MLTVVADFHLKGVLIFNIIGSVLKPGYAGALKYIVFPVEEVFRCLREQ